MHQYSHAQPMHVVVLHHNHLELLHIAGHLEDVGLH